MVKLLTEFVTGNCQEFFLSKVDFLAGLPWIPGESPAGVVLTVFSKVWSSVWWLIPHHSILSLSRWCSPPKLSAKARSCLSVICSKLLSPAMHCVSNLRFLIPMMSFQETPGYPETIEFCFFLPSFTTEYLLSTCWIIFIMLEARTIDITKTWPYHQSKKPPSGRR